MFGLDLAALLGGAVITETIFNLPGIGQYLIRRCASRTSTRSWDHHLDRGVLRDVANLVVDIVYAFLDPRVRYD